MSKFVKRFSRNIVGRDFIVGDIHGHFTRLEIALSAMGFNPDVDRLFSVGDLVDRGPESMESLKWVEKPWFHPVQGNHEAMAIDYEAGNGSAGHYAANGGAWNIANDKVTQRNIALALSALPIAIELETANGTVGIVHADVPAPSWGKFVGSLESKLTSDAERGRLISMAQWSRTRINHGDRSPVQGILAVVVGHTPMDSVAVLGNVIHIDTGGWLGREFTILDAAMIGCRDSSKPGEAA